MASVVERFSGNTWSGLDKVIEREAVQKRWQGSFARSYGILLGNRIAKYIAARTFTDFQSQQHQMPQNPSLLSPKKWKFHYDISQASLISTSLAAEGAKQEIFVSWFEKKASVNPGENITVIHVPEDFLQEGIEQSEFDNEATSYFQLARFVRQISNLMFWELSKFQNQNPAFRCTINYAFVNSKFDSQGNEQSSWLEIILQQ